MLTSNWKSYGLFSITAIHDIRCHISLVQFLTHAPYAVGIFAFGRAVLFLFLFSVFALYERKN
jgi:hypothetical protein